MVAHPEASQTPTFTNLDAETRCSPSCAVSARPWCWTSTTPTRSCAHLLAHDADAFNRWEAGQHLQLRIAINTIADEAYKTGARTDLTKPSCLQSLWSLCAGLRNPAAWTRHSASWCSRLPSETYIAEQLDVVDLQRIHAVREAMREELALALQSDWETAREQNQGHRRLPPRPLSLRPPRAQRSGAAHAVHCRAEDGDVVWPGKAYQRFQGGWQHDGPLQRPDCPVASSSELAALPWHASTPCSRTSPWSSTSGLHCRPAN